MPDPTGEWRIFLAEAPDRPVVALLDEGIYAALMAYDRNAWKALLQFLSEHAAS